MIPPVFLLGEEYTIAAQRNLMEVKTRLKRYPTANSIAKSIAEFLFQICHESIQPLIRYEVSNVLSLLF